MVAKLKNIVVDEQMFVEQCLLVWPELKFINLVSQQSLTEIIFCKMGKDTFSGHVSF